MIKIFCALVLGVSITIDAKLDETFKWREVPYAWPSEKAKLDAINSGKYIERNNLMLGLDVWKDKLFVTVPRLKVGVASSLNYIKLGTNEKSPLLHPYPSWEANKLPSVSADEIFEQNNSTIISSFRVRVDECDRLWVMDYGVVDVFGSPKQVAPANIAIFDLNTDELIRRYIIPSNQVRANSILPNIVVDTQASKCLEAFAYIPDLSSYAVIVYDFWRNKSFRVRHNYFYFDPIKGDFNVAGINFQWADGVFSLALGKAINKNGERTVYFHAFASTTEFSVPNTVLKNESLATSRSSYHAYSILGDRGPKSQASASFYDDKTDSIFYTQVNRDAISCWNTKTPFNAENQGIVDSDSVKLIFPNDLKVSRDGTLFVLSNRMTLFQYSTLPQDYNYRILTGKTSELIGGTPCEGKDTLKNIGGLIEKRMVGPISQSWNDHSTGSWGVSIVN